MTCPTCCGEGMTGVELRGIYDGVAYWYCEHCQRRVHRWPSDSSVGQRVRDWVKDVAGTAIEEPAS